MADREKCIPPELASAEARAAAHQLRAIAARLLALAHLLPLPRKTSWTAFSPAVRSRSSATSPC